MSRRSEGIGKSKSEAAKKLARMNLTRDFGEDGREVSDRAKATAQLGSESKKKGNMRGLSDKSLKQRLKTAQRNSKMGNLEATDIAGKTKANMARLEVKRIKAELSRRAAGGNIGG